MNKQIKEDKTGLRYFDKTIINKRDNINIFIHVKYYNAVTNRAL